MNDVLEQLSEFLDNQIVRKSIAAYIHLSKALQDARKHQVRVVERNGVYKIANPISMVTKGINASISRLR